MVSVRNMKSPRSGKPVANQFIIQTDEAEYFQSYDAVIVRIDSHGITLDANSWDYSVTTGKYRNRFLHENKKETQRKIDNGTYKLADLNA